MKQISILGCGWLGLPLAKSLLKKGFLVNGSTTTFEKISVLENAGIHSFQLELQENAIDGDIHSFLRNSELLIIDIPPKLRGNSKENFVAKIRTLLPFIEKSSVEKVIFVSSTSVYADDLLSVSTISEDTIPNPETESGKQLVQAEKLLQNNANFITTVIRFGGLIGEDRHPIRFLAGKKNIENPNGPINLIHQKDCIGIIQKIIETNCWNETFNAVGPFHPTRKEYYIQKATELNLPLPEFEVTSALTGKIVFSEKVERVLGYKFKKVY